MSTKIRNNWFNLITHATGFFYHIILIIIYIESIPRVLKLLTPFLQCKKFKKTCKFINPANQMDLLEQKSSENLWVSQAKRKVEAPLFPPVVRKISERWHIESQQKVFGLDKKAKKKQMSNSNMSKSCQKKKNSKFVYGKGIPSRKLEGGVNESLACKGKGKRTNTGPRC